MGNVERENYGSSESFAMLDDELFWDPSVAEFDQDERASVAEGASPVPASSSTAMWQEVLDPVDFFDESEYVDGGAHFPPTIAI